MFAKLQTRIRDLARDSAGNAAIIFGLSAIPLIGISGLAIDYGYMLTVKAKIDMASDAATIAGANAASAYFAAYTGTGDPTSAAVAAAQAQAKAQFLVNLGQLPANATLTFSDTAANPPTTSSSVSPNISRTNSMLTSNIAYSLQMPSVIMGILGTKTLSFSGVSTSTVTLPTYYNIILVVDTSKSMGIGATSSDMNLVNNVSPGCAVACHFPGSDTASSARANGATLRIDAAKAAVYQALATIPSNYTYNVYIYTMSDKFTQVFPLPTGSPNAQLANDITGNTADPTGKYSAQSFFAPIGTNSWTIDLANTTNDGGTDTTTNLSQLASTLAALKAPNGSTVVPGDGLTPQTAKGIVMLITDGVQDSDMKVASGGGFADQSEPAFTVLSPCNYSSCMYNSTFGVYMEAMDPAACTPIKTLGYSLMTLNANYLIPPVSMQSTSDFQTVFNYIQNNLLSSITTNMAACATSSAQAYVATSPTDLVTSVQAMFSVIPQKKVAQISQ